jgi:hypothetical protein
MGNPASAEFKPGENIPEVAEKWAKALALRTAGATFDQIARQLGYASPSGAYEAVMSALKATLREPAESVRVMEVERLDRLMLGLWKAATATATATDPRGPDLESLDRVLKIMDRRAKLLGLDAPQKVAATTPDGTAEAMNGLPPGGLDRLAILLTAAQERRDKDQANHEPG